MIRMSGQDRERPVYLFCQHQPGEFMGKGYRSERKNQPGAGASFGFCLGQLSIRPAIGWAYRKDNDLYAVIPLAADPGGQFF